jgi:hypothetical protein
MVGKASEKGRFALANVPEGVWDIVIQKPGFGRAVLEDVTVQAGRPIVIAEPITLAPEAGGTAGIKAAIRDGSGKAVIGATVTVFAADGASTTATSDGQGNVTISNLPDGDYTVQVYRPFYQPASGQPATVKDGALTDLGEIKLQSTTMYFGQTTGQVVDEYGDPVDGAVVMLDPPVTEQIFTDAQGRFTLDRIMPGEYTLNIAAGGMEVSSTHLRIDNAPNTKVTYEEPILMRQSISVASNYRLAQVGARQADLVAPVVETGLLEDNRVVLYWESPDAAQLPEGIVSVHYEVEHLDDAEGSPDGNDEDGYWTRVEAKADVSYVLASEDWDQDEFRVRAIGVDEDGDEYVSDWQEISLNEPASASAGAAYSVQQAKGKIGQKAAKKHPKMTKGKKGKKKPVVKKKRKPLKKKGILAKKKLAKRQPLKGKKPSHLTTKLAVNKAKQEAAAKQKATSGQVKPIQKVVPPSKFTFSRDRRKGT